MITEIQGGALVGIHQYVDLMLCSAKKGFIPLCSRTMLVTTAYCSYLADHGRTSTGELFDTSCVLCPNVNQMVSLFFLLLNFFFIRHRICQARSIINAFHLLSNYMYHLYNRFAFCFPSVCLVHALCQLIALGSDQLESPSYFVHCAHLLFTTFVI